MRRGRSSPPAPCPTTGAPTSSTSLADPRPWAVERRTGSAAGLHALELPDPVERAVWVLAVERPAIVLGSTQRGAVVAPEGVDLARRRSGGGAVWLTPATTLWVDVLLPRRDPLWVDDVGRAALWLGEAWASALAATGLEGAVVHRGPMVRTPWSAALCFSGVAAGEVTLGPAGPKLVGISQRRTRAGARFQCVAYERWDAVPLARAVGVPWDEVERAGAGVGDRLPALEAALLASLPTA